jgi:hypothetical protein
LKLAVKTQKASKLEDVEEGLQRRLRAPVPDRCQTPVNARPQTGIGTRDLLGTGEKAKLKTGEKFCCKKQRQNSE